MCIRDSYKANKGEKKILYTETFLKTMLRDDWSSWPNPNTIIDPNTTAIYEDQPMSSPPPTTVPAGQLDQKSLSHATEMLYGELNAVWQKSLNESSQYSEIALDVNAMDLPGDIFQNVLFKIDHFMGSLQLDAAEKNRLNVGTVPAESTLNLNSEELDALDSYSIKSKPKFDFKDIIIQACEMGEDMSQEYLKAVDLFQDIPEDLDQSLFVLSDKYLQKFSQLKLGDSDSEVSSDGNINSANHNGDYASKRNKKDKKSKASKKKSIEKSTESRDEEEEDEEDIDAYYVLMKRIVKDRKNDPKVRKEARLLIRKDEFARDKKMFLTVLDQKKNFSDSEISSDYGLDDLD